MLENALNGYGVSAKGKIAVKTLVSAGLIALAVLLPQLVHAALGQPGGVKWLPMYLPILLGGCLLGSRWALSVGLLSPLVSFLVTSIAGSPMPVLERLPFMMAELAVFALVSGLFTQKIAQNGWWAFVAVPAAQLAGRLSFLVLAVIFQGVVSFTPAMILQQLQAGLAGVLVQMIAAPVILLALRWLLLKDDRHE